MQQGSMVCKTQLSCVDNHSDDPFLYVIIRTLMKTTDTATRELQTLMLCLNTSAGVHRLTTMRISIIYILINGVEVLLRYLF